MDLVELQDVVDAIVGKKRLGGLRPHELMASIHRKSLPAGAFPIIEPLLHIKDGATYKYAIDMVGKMKGVSSIASEAIEAAWERSWEHDVPQACKEAFRAMLRIGNNDERLLAMVTRAMEIENYGIHKECAETLMKLSGGKDILAKWNETIPGKCDCDLHTKLASKIAEYLATT
jgi:hypothetical protein